MLDVMHNTPFTDMNDSEGETQEMGYAALAVADRMLDLLTAVVNAALIDPERVAANLRRSCATITELADTLVRSESLSFRLAHEVAARVAHRVVGIAGDIEKDGYEPFVDAFTKVIGKPPSLDAEGFRSAVSAAHFIAVRERFGGPGLKVLETAIEGYRSQEAKFAERAKSRSEREAMAAAELETKITELAGGA